MSRAEIIGRDPATDVPVRLTFARGLITAIEPSDAATDFYLSPGLIDLQVNGYAGFDLNAEQISIEMVVGLTDAMLAKGTTCFAPTLITAPEERICHALSVIAHARKLHDRVAHCVPFVHIEGPHISPTDGYRGAHPADSIRPPSIAEFDRWQKAADGLVGMVTLSPHFEESAEYIRALVARGVHIAIGHTHGSPEQIKVAIDAGARLSTHLGNGIADLIPRHRNPIWLQLADDRLTATFITDGQHLPPDVLKSMLRVKGIPNSILISDSVSLAGMPPGKYTTSVGGQVELQPDGRLCIPGSDYLAGSTSSLAQCVARAVRDAKVPLNDALLMATGNPGAFTGGRGQLAIGSLADLIRFRWSDELILDSVWLAGEHVVGAAS